MQKNVAEEFFIRIFDSKNPRPARLTVNAFMAISSFGNVVVWTFTAARMKQEIAKQCFLPFSKFFAMDKDVSFGRFLMWLEGSERNARRISFLNPANHREKTPVGAFVLHLICCIVLICATFGMKSEDAYKALSTLFSYLLAAWFGAFLALGILLLHIRGPPSTQPVQTPNHNRVPDQAAVKRTWGEITKGSVNQKVSITCAILYLLGSLYPVIASWVAPPKSQVKPSVVWYAVPLAAVCILVFSTMWFYGFLGIAEYRRYYGKEEFFRVSSPEFDYADSGDPAASDDGLPDDDGASIKRRGGLILSHETIHPAWRPSEIVPSQRMTIRRRPVGLMGPAQKVQSGIGQRGEANEYSNGDSTNGYGLGLTNSRHGRDPSTNNPS